jgi:hypothetical protein
MNTFEKCKAIRRCLVNRAAEVMVYNNWSGDLAKSHIVGLPREAIDKLKLDDLILSGEEMDFLEFGRWSKESPVRLIPLWLFPFLPDVIETESILGEKATLKKSEMDLDNCFGMLAYGVFPKP